MLQVRLFKTRTIFFRWSRYGKTLHGIQGKHVGRLSWSVEIILFRYSLRSLLYCLVFLDQISFGWQNSRHVYEISLSISQLAQWLLSSSWALLAHICSWAAATMMSRGLFLCNANFVCRSFYSVNWFDTLNKVGYSCMLGWCHVPPSIPFTDKFVLICVLIWMMRVNG